jgi:zinc protease
MKEFRGVVGEAPPTADELVKVKQGQVLTLPGRWETIGAIRSSIAEQVNLGLPDDYWDSYADDVEGLSLGEVRESARNRIRPERILWVVVGDRARVEEALRGLDFIDEIRVIDARGEVQPTSATGPGER